MNCNASPGALGSNDQLGLEHERAEFEAAMATKGYHTPPNLDRDGTYRDTCYSAGWDAWQVAKAAERKRLKADAEEWGNALNTAGWAVTEAYRKHTGKVEPVIFFNHAKAILRDGIAAYFAALKA